MLFRNAAIQIGVVTSIFIGWITITNFSLVSPLIIPPLSLIYVSALQHSREVLPNLAITLSEVGITTAIATPLGILGGVAIGYNSFLSKTFTPLLVAMFAVPTFVLYPLFTVWFGLGMLSKIAFAFSLAFLPIILNCISGVRQVERRYILLCKSIKCSTWTTLVRVVVPFALPSIMAGLRTGVALIEVGVIVSEMLGAYGGIGTLISTYQSEFLIPAVYFIIFVVAAFVYATIIAFRIIDLLLTKRNLKGN